MNVAQLFDERVTPLLDNVLQAEPWEERVDRTRDGKSFCLLLSGLADATYEYIKNAIQTLFGYTDTIVVYVCDDQRYVSVTGSA
jgi:hypothetical protein